MTQDSTPLEQLVLEYIRQLGGVVEPPAYGAYEVLLPDEAIARWKIPAEQKFIFDAAYQQDGATFLHYGHTLVETIVEELRVQSANGHFFINNVRLGDPADGTITAYMIRRKSELAVRWWAMTDKGISANCNCEKMLDCRERGLVYLPWADLDEQMYDLLNSFRDEYHLPHNKTRYFQIRVGKPFEEKKLKIPSDWRDEATLAKAKKGFHELSKRNSG